MTASELRKLLQPAAEAERLDLYARADAVRRARVGEEVHLRGLVEVSNYCSRQCHYCGIRADHREVTRYRMRSDEVLQCAQLAVKLGYGTLVLQAGEDPGLTRDAVAHLIRRLKSETPLAVTLSLGERALAELKAWRDAGADRYLLRFETSNEELYRRIHPPLRADAPDRFTLLGMLRDLGYEVGSGVMIGVPGQTFDDAARDLERCRELDLDMIGIGPYLPHPATPLGQRPPSAAPDQVPNSEEMTYLMLAGVRLACPATNIPATTALATLNAEGGRTSGLQRGANVIMPNLTPMEYRRCYEIYPGKRCVSEPPEEYDARLRAQLAALGRPAGCGQGASPNWQQRRGIAAAQ